MVTEIHLQSKLDENNECIIAQSVTIDENAWNKEVIVLVQELRHIIKYLEDELYYQWLEDFENE